MPADARSRSGPGLGYPPELAAVPDLNPAELHVYALPMVERFRGITVREGVLLAGPAGWGEFCPFAEYDDEVAVPWLATALEAAWLRWPASVRGSVEVNATVPAVGPERAAAIVRASGARTAKVKVADAEQSRAAGDERALAADADRVAAVREALGPAGHVRVDANGNWDVDSALHALGVLDAAAGGLQYAEQPCRTVQELAEVRRRTGVRIAADESIRRAEDPLAVARAGAADVAVLKAAPLGGVRRALAVAGAVRAEGDLQVVVSSALETSVGLAAELALAAALPRLELACGLGTLALFEGDVVATTTPRTPGRLAVPGSPPVPDSTLLERYAQRDPEPGALVAGAHPADARASAGSARLLTDLSDLSGRAVALVPDAHAPRVPDEPHVVDRDGEPVGEVPDDPRVGHAAAGPLAGGRDEQHGRRGHRRLGLHERLDADPRAHEVLEVAARGVLLLLALRARGCRPSMPAEQSHPTPLPRPRTRLRSPVRSPRCGRSVASMTCGRRDRFPRDGPITGRTRQERVRPG